MIADRKAVYKIHGECSQDRFQGVWCEQSQWGESSWATGVTPNFETARAFNGNSMSGSTFVVPVIVIR